MSTTTEVAAAPIRILIVDDHAVMRAGLRMLIESQPDMKVVGEAGTSAEAVAAAASEKPDAVLLDLDLRGESGLDALPDLLSSAKGARVIILTGVRDPATHRRAIRLGAMGLVLKEKAAEILLKAIRKVHSGEVWIDRAMTASVLAEISGVSPSDALSPEAGRIMTLTPREREVISLVGEGLRNRQIAERLFISETTVHHHLTSVFGKLQVADRFELIIFSYRHSLAKPPQ